MAAATIAYHPGLVERPGPTETITEHQIYVIGANNKLYILQIITGPDGIISEATVEAPESPAGVKLNPDIEIRFPKVHLSGDRGSLALAHRYFREAYDRWQAEAICFFLLDPESPEHYTLVAPEDSVGNGGHVTYSPIDYFCPEDQIGFAATRVTPDENGDRHCPHCKSKLKPAIIAGSIHSHCDFSAFHSGTDDAHEVGSDGFHFTIGHVKKSATPFLETSWMVAAGNTRFKTTPTEMVDVGLTDKGLDVVSFWMTTCLNSQRQKAEEKKHIVTDAKGRQVGLFESDEELEAWASYRALEKKYNVHSKPEKGKVRVISSIDRVQVPMANLASRRTVVLVPTPAHKRDEVVGEFGVVDPPKQEAVVQKALEPYKAPVKKEGGVRHKGSGKPSFPASLLGESYDLTRKFEVAKSEASYLMSALLDSGEAASVIYTVSACLALLENTKQVSPNDEDDQTNDLMLFAESSTGRLATPPEVIIAVDCFLKEVKAKLGSNDEALGDVNNLLDEVFGFIDEYMPHLRHITTVTMEVLT